MRLAWRDIMLAHAGLGSQTGNLKKFNQVSREVGNLKQ
jgi:hypothetical protein